MSAGLYTLEVLRLAAASAAFPRLVSPDATAERRALPCGSRIVIDLAFAADGRVAAFGQHIHACAMGQAAAAILARHAIGRTPDELIAARDALARWLTETDAPEPSWPGIEALDRARSFPARHGAMRLPFETAAAAAAMIAS